jgi:hypothetical protein
MKNTHFSSHKAEDHLGEKFVTTDDKHAWHGQEIEVSSDPLVEEGPRGRTIVLRSFYFKANPEIMKRDKPTKQQLFNSHAKQIELMLWGDGLIPFHGVEPKLIVSKKRDEYKIFIACEARNGVTITETPTLLQDLTKPKVNAT